MYCFLFCTISIFSNLRRLADQKPLLWEDAQFNFFFFTFSSITHLVLAVALKQTFDYIIFIQNLKPTTNGSSNPKSANECHYVWVCMLSLSVCGVGGGWSFIRFIIFIVCIVCSFVHFIHILFAKENNGKGMSLKKMKCHIIIPIHIVSTSLH